MNKEQGLSILRNILSIIMGVLIGKGILTAEQAAGLSSDIMIAAPALGGMATVAWGLWSAQKSKQIANVQAMPEVAKIVVKDDVNGTIGTMAQADDKPKIVTETQNAVEVKKAT